MIRVLAFLFCFVSTAWADSYQPSHDCSEPTEPFDMTNDWERQQYIDEIEEYKQCIEEFIEEQELAVRNHQNAADEAVDDWNGFASSLN